MCQLYNEIDLVKHVRINSLTQIYDEQIPERIFIARPEGKDGIKRSKVKLLDADIKNIGERNWRRQARGGDE
jgi:hypothetical protein